jgi:hypothetical protein|tara:strand:- start:30 stop:1010 length:981 start_codon:yes stop_codon:yes gene_type:complete
MRKKNEWQITIQFVQSAILHFLKDTQDYIVIIGSVQGLVKRWLRVVKVEHANSIFIKICSLDDTELSSTILDAVFKSSKPKNLYFGVYLMYKDKKTLSDLESAKNIARSYGSKFYTIAKPLDTNNLGVGRARKIVDDMYGGQDYVLQIDAHSWFPWNWDTTLKSLMYYKNPKTILTGYAAPYHYAGSHRQPKDTGKLMLPEMTREKTFCEWLPENWRPIYPTTEDPFIPTKFCANFAFGTHKWGEYSGIFEKAIFFSEEPVQTINLQRKGFKLEYPNIDEALICHLYAQDINSRGRRKAFTDYLSEYESNYLMNVMDRHYFESNTS